MFAVGSFQTTVSGGAADPVLQRQATARGDGSAAPAKTLKAAPTEEGDDAKGLSMQDAMDFVSGTKPEDKEKTEEEKKKEEDEKRTVCECAPKRVRGVIKFEFF